MMGIFPIPETSIRGRRDPKDDLMAPLPQFTGLPPLGRNRDVSDCKFPMRIRHGTREDADGCTSRGRRTRVGAGPKSGRGDRFWPKCMDRLLIASEFVRGKRKSDIA